MTPAAEKKTLLVFDGHALLHRAYHALPALTNRHGETIGACFGFFSMLIAAIRETKPRWVAVCLDSPGPNFRHREFVGYQAKRPITEESLVSQIEKAKKMLVEADIPCFRQSGFEADDLVATLIKKTRKKVKRILVITGDRDLMQLVDQKTNLLLLGRQLEQFLQVGKNEVVEKMGVAPSQIVDYKGLVGDSSDNYPGVPGIGPKTAADLLAKYHNFEGVYANLSVLPESLRKKLEEGKEAGTLSLLLAQIVDDAPVKIKTAKLRWRKTMLLGLKKVLQKEGFVSLVKRIDKFFGLEEKQKVVQTSLFTEK